jgi:hypothetical protein
MTLGTSLPADAARPAARNEQFGPDRSCPVIDPAIL